MTTTTLIDTAAVPSGRGLATRLALQSTTGGVSLNAKLTATDTHRPALIPRVRLCFAFLSEDLGATPDAAELLSLVSREEVPLSVPMNLGEITRTAVPLTSADGAYIYAWVDGVSFSGTIKVEINEL